MGLKLKRSGGGWWLSFSKRFTPRQRPKQAKARWWARDRMLATFRRREGKREE